MTTTMTGNKSRWNIWRTIIHFRDKPNESKVRPFVILGMCYGSDAERYFFMA